MTPFLSRFDARLNEKLTTFGLVLSFAALLLLSVIAWNIAVPLASYKSVSHTRDVMTELDCLTTSLLRASSYNDAYVFTKEPNYLSDRSDSIVEAKAALEKVRLLTIDNPNQQARIKLLEMGIKERFDNFSQIQKLFEQGGMGAALEEYKQGRLIVTKVRTLVIAAETEEKQLLIDRQILESLRINIVLYGLLIVLVLLLAVYAWTRRNSAMVRAKQSELLKSGTLQNAVISSSKLSIIATDTAGVIQIYSFGAQKMLGYSTDQLLQIKTPTTLFQPDYLLKRAEVLKAEYGVDVQADFEALVYAAKFKDEDDFEVECIRSDQTLIEVLMSVTALRDASKQIIGYLFIATDDTQRKLAVTVQGKHDVQINKLQLYTRSLFESTIDAIVTIDFDGNIADLNRPMVELIGFDREVVLGKPFASFFTDAGKAAQAIETVLKEGSIRDVELTTVSQTGKETPVSCNAKQLLDQDKGLRWVIAAIRDVTVYKEIAQTLEDNNTELKLATASAEKANRAKSDFLSSMSHELRTPLNAVLGFAQLLSSDKPPPTQSQQLAINQILQAGWYLLKLIDEVLDLAMIEAGKVEISLNPVVLADVLDECLQMIGPQANKKSISLKQIKYTNTWHVLADRTYLKQVVLNLLSNAIKYSPAGATVTVDCQVVSPSAVRVFVSDNGLGIAEPLLPQLFQPFNRLGLKGGATAGSGIGLAVSKQLVELMGGKIGVQSTEGQGSSFWFDLSRVDESSVESLQIIQSAEQTAAAAPPKHQPTNGYATPKKTLLYIEDNPANLLLAEQILERRKMVKLITATTAEQGLQLAKLNRPDVIFMDINLPGMSGNEALQILKRDVDTQDIPVLAVSANALASEIFSGKAAGFSRYITKPINVGEFLLALDQALMRDTK